MSEHDTPRLGGELICIVPALRLPPDEQTLARIHAMHCAVGHRQLTPLEVLACLTPEGSA